jgi:hypothetical protein
MRLPGEHPGESILNVRNETVRYGELDGQSYIPLLDGLSNFGPLSSSFKKREVPRRGFPFVLPPPGFGGFLSP